MQILNRHRFQTISPGKLTGFRQLWREINQFSRQEVSETGDNSIFAECIMTAKDTNEIINQCGSCNICIITNLLQYTDQLPILDFDCYDVGYINFNLLSGLVHN